MPFEEEEPAEPADERMSESYGYMLARALYAASSTRPVVRHAPFSATALHAAQACAHADALPRRLLEAVQQQLASIPTSREGTIWFGAGLQPRTPIECAIRTLEQLVAPPKEYAGCEWWVQRVSLPKRPEVALHWDKDECEAARRIQWTHPALASVLYLADSGGPTVVLPWTAETATQRPRDGEIFASFPKKNRFLTFQGNLMHGVAPRHFNPGTRLTLLVNWWWAKPEAPCCQPPSTMHTMADCPIDVDCKAAAHPSSIVPASHRQTREGDMVLDLQLPGLAGGGNLRLAVPWAEDGTGAEPGTFVRWTG